MYIVDCSKVCMNICCPYTLYKKTVELCDRSNSRPHKNQVIVLHKARSFIGTKLIFTFIVYVYKTDKVVHVRFYIFLLLFKIYSNILLAKLILL